MSEPDLLDDIEAMARAQVRAFAVHVEQGYRLSLDDIKALDTLARTVAACRDDVRKAELALAKMTDEEVAAMQRRTKDK